MASLFNKDIRFLKGVGARYTELFNKLGVSSVGSLLFFYPRAYEDWSNPYTISSCPINEICCVKGIVASPVQKSIIRKGMTLYKLKICDNYSTMNITYFNIPFVSKSLTEGKEFIFYGKVIYRNSRKEMNSPNFKDASLAHSLHPVYHSTQGLTSKKIENCVKNALNLLPETIKDPIPKCIREKYNLVDLKCALNNIHFPTSNENLLKARKRLIFEELLILQLGLLNLKYKSRKTNAMKIQQGYFNEFQELLPFSLTNAQIKAIADCTKDMSKYTSIMNRLIQGDVGSGKTAVAAALAYTVYKNHMQTAIMAPTEILAEQHYNWFSSVFSQTNIKIALLTGSTPLVQKRRIKEALKLGEIDIIIGTHALLTDNVEFSSLCLAVTDEQHRFGVSQRAKLASKGKSPHMLIMSATPIPRTLGLIMYSDLDISVLDELPAGRQKIDTFLINSKKRYRALNFIKSFINEGKQAYIVCPLVEESDSNLASAEKYYEELASGIFKNFNIGLVHGKMSPREKQNIMDKFNNKDISLLISTTVIEVGIDNPNAVIIMIENAERFGLSQLHQLRGRVGRGSYKSYCIMVSDAQNEEALRRFKIMKETNNGFKIADEDLKLRGPGDFFGHKQHGLPELKIANMMTDTNILIEAQHIASKLIEEDPSLESEKYKGLKAEINRLFSSIGEYGLN